MTLRFACLGAMFGAVAAAQGRASAQQVTFDDSTVDTLVIEPAKQRLTSALTTIGLAQIAYHQAYGRYASSVRLLHHASAFGLGPGASVIILAAGQDGWSAIAADSSVPEVRCATHAGKAKSPFGDQSADNDVSCASDPYPPRALVDSDRVFSDIERPANLRCAVQRLPVRLQRPGRVILQFILDPEGHPEPRSIRFIASPDLLDDMAALVVLSGCEYRSARVGGKRVRVLIQQPFDLKQ